MSGLVRLKFWLVVKDFSHELHLWPLEKLDYYVPTLSKKLTLVSLKLPSKDIFLVKVLLHYVTRDVRLITDRGCCRRVDGRKSSNSSSISALDSPLKNLSAALHFFLKL
jgi:hypothetical protein